MVGIGIIALTFVALAALWRWGGWEERVIAAVAALLVAAVPLAEPVRLGTWRAGVALLDLILFVLAAGLAISRDRWWLTALAGLQAITVLTHLAPLLVPGNYTWTVVTLRLEVWILICIIFFCGAWEASAARRFALGGAHDPTDSR